MTSTSLARALELADTDRRARSGRPPWLSAHLHSFHPTGSTEFDSLALNVVAPCVRRLQRSGLIRRWFFVRYNESGPHLRIRVELLRQRDAARARAIVEAAARRANAAVPLELRWVEYQPEFERYGGVRGTRVAEHLFHLSSEAALRVLGQHGLDDRSRRLGQALLTLVVTFGVFIRRPESCARHLGVHSQGLLRRAMPHGVPLRDATSAFAQSIAEQGEVLKAAVHEAWRALSFRHSITAALDPYARGLRRVRARLHREHLRGALRAANGAATGFEATVASLVPSYAHMTMNRMGVSVREEAYLARAAQNALQSEHDGGA